MKKIIFASIILVCLFSTLLSSGPYPFAASALDEKGGRYITAEGNLHVFAVFIKWQDDAWGADSVEWPLTGTPEWQQNFMDNTPGVSLAPDNLSQYFTEMSGGIFELTADIYPEVFTPSLPQSHFTGLVNGPALANRMILEELDADVDFSLYDNWTTDTTLTHRNVPDGKVDMIMLIHRVASAWVVPYCGYAGLDIDGKDYITNDGVTVMGGTCGDFGSGLQLKYAIEGPEWTKYVTAHELGHYMLGSGHLGSLPYLSLMRNGLASGSSAGMCSIEKEMLGWMNFIEIPQTGNHTITLNDFMTTNDAIKINTLRDDEYFILENRQHYSVHDKPADTGLYIYHVNGKDYDSPLTDVECADGNWHFDYSFEEQDQLHVFRTMPDENHGDETFDELTFWDFAHNGTDSTLIYCHRNIYEEGHDAWGDEQDAFSLDFNPVFTPWSNPDNRLDNEDNNLTFSMEILEENYQEGTITINLDFSDPTVHKPFMPIGLRINNEGCSSWLSWRYSREPDFSHYEIYKKIGGNDFILYDTTGQSTYHDDNRYLFIEGLYKDEVDIAYKIKAIDNSGMQSLFSNTAEIFVEFDGYKLIPNNMLYTCRNYPNPFNPRTTIKFFNPEQGPILISIYNIKGQLIKALYNGIKGAGWQSVAWDGTNTDGNQSSSGIYFYKIESKNDEFIERMLLLK